MAKLIEILHYKCSYCDTQFIDQGQAMQHLFVHAPAEDWVRSRRVLTVKQLDDMERDTYWQCDCGYKGIKYGHDDYRFNGGMLSDRQEMIDAHLPLIVLFAPKDVD